MAGRGLAVIGSLAARLVPRQLDNRFLGHVLAVWLLVPLTLVKLLQGANVAGLFGPGNSRRILEGVDRVPVGAFPAEAGSHVVFLFAAWGLGIFILGLVGVVALLRYRAAIPMVYVLLLIEQLGRKTLTTIHLDRPFVSLTASPASLVNWGFLLVIVVGLSLSLLDRGPRT